VARRSLVIVPVINVSAITQHAIAEALSLGPDVVALYVALDYPDEERDDGAELEALWRAWHPGVALEVLHTEYSSVVEPILQYIDHLRAKGDRQLVVLIPVIEPRRLRYRLLHNHLDLVLGAALRRRADVVVARVRMPLEETPRASRAVPPA
jgi:hypothetical protein